LRIQKHEEEARKIVILKPEDKIKQRQGTAEQVGKREDSRRGERVKSEERENEELDCLQPAVPAPPVVSPEKIEKKAKTKNKKKKKIPKVLERTRFYPQMLRS
jgi:hypothetical protein